jgi:two-component system cell cycle response regulator DivK
MANERILIIEDDRKNMKLARDLLQLRGYSITEATTAEEGLALAARDAPDLVLMDIQLPGMSGIQALALLRAEEPLRQVPVVAFTASVMTQDRHLILKAGFDAMVFKPISIREFCNTIATALAGRGA